MGLERHPNMMYLIGKKVEKMVLATGITDNTIKFTDGTRLVVPKIGYDMPSPGDVVTNVLASFVSDNLYLVCGSKIYDISRFSYED